MELMYAPQTNASLHHILSGNCSEIGTLIPAKFDALHGWSFKGCSTEATPIVLHHNLKHTQQTLLNRFSFSMVQIHFQSYYLLLLYLMLINLMTVVSKFRRFCVCKWVWPCLRPSTCRPMVHCTNSTSMVEHKATALCYCEVNIKELLVSSERYWS